MGVIFSLLRRPERVGLLLSAFASVAACSDSAHSQATPAGGIHDGVPIYLKIDFDDGENPFDETFRSDVGLLDDSTGSLSGKSLHVERAWNGGTIGVSTSLEVVGATDLRIAFMVRAREMPTIAVNAFDERHDDNTTPASPARIVENEWRPVVFALEDFHFNSDPPDQKIPAEDVELVSLLFHGGDGEAGASFAVDKVVVYRGVDRVPPAAPGDVAGVVDGGGVLLQWQEPSDGTFSVVYSVHRRNEKGSWEKIGESLRPSYRDASPKAGANVYRVTAADY
jgi:hypothetical protein